MRTSKEEIARAMMAVGEQALSLDQHALVVVYDACERKSFVKIGDGECPHEWGDRLIDLVESIAEIPPCTHEGHS